MYYYYLYRIQNMEKEANIVTGTCENHQTVTHTGLIHQSVILQENENGIRTVDTNLHICRKLEKRRETETSSVKNIQVSYFLQKVYYNYTNKGILLHGILGFQ